MEMKEKSRASPPCRKLEKKLSLRADCTINSHVDKFNWGVELIERRLHRERQSEALQA
jgi:hypothetical protein